MPASESSIVASILFLLRNHGWAVKQHGSAFSTIGTPDVLGCVSGRMVAIEVKRPGELASKAQLVQLEKWRRAGALAMVATSAGEVRNVLASAGLLVKV